MPAKRLSMRKIKDVLRLCWGQGLSKRKAARSCGVSRPAVDEYLRRGEAAGLCWPLPAAFGLITAPVAYSGVHNEPESVFIFTGIRTALRRSNTITVEINIALDVLSRRVGGLFARDDATGNTVLLHRGRIGGGKKGVGKATFMEWYPDNPVTYSASAHPDLIEPAILLTDLVSDDFLHHLEVFVHRVHQFKSSDRENEVSNLLMLYVTGPRHLN